MNYKEYYKFSDAELIETLRRCASNDVACAGCPIERIPACCADVLKDIAADTIKRCLADIKDLKLTVEKYKPKPHWELSDDKTLYMCSECGLMMPASGNFKQTFVHCPRCGKKLVQ